MGFSGKKYDLKGTSLRENKDDHKGCFNYQKLDHLIVDCPDLQKAKVKKENFQNYNFINKVKKSLMETWD